MSYFFDELRKNHPNFSADHPLLQMEEETLKHLAKENGFDDVQAFLMMALQPSETMTCPLCGMPQNHLSNCKGCGKAPFSNWEFLDVYGEKAPLPLKTELEHILLPHHPDVAGYVALYVYDCLVCKSCWQEAIATSRSYVYCPLKLFSDRVLTGSIVQGLLYIGDADLMMTTLKQGVAQWLQDPAKAAWRTPIYTVALSSER